MNLDDLAFEQNLTIYLSDIEDEVSRVADPDYEQFLTDVWVGIVLTLIVLCCICFMCSCLLYHKFQQWKRSVLQSRQNGANVDAFVTTETESLPSYTIVSGLPSYNEALEELRKMHIQSKNTTVISDKDTCVPRTPLSPVSRLSMAEIFQMYKNTSTVQSVDGKT